MSDTTIAAQSSGGTPKVSRISEAVIRIAGNSQDGIQAIGGTAKDKGKNIFALGLVARMFDLNVPKLEQLLSERFGGKDISILNNALAAFHAGYSHSLGNVLETFKFVEGTHKSGQQVVMNGNEALAFGLIAA